MKSKTQIKRQYAIIRIAIALMQLDGKYTLDQAKQRYNRATRAYLNVYFNTNMY